VALFVEDVFYDAQGQGHWLQVTDPGYLYGYRLEVNPFLVSDKAIGEAQLPCAWLPAPRSMAATGPLYTVLKERSLDNLVEEMNKIATKGYAPLGVVFRLTAFDEYAIVMQRLSLDLEVDIDSDSRIAP
jgi:hypothetical protein